MTRPLTPLCADYTADCHCRRCCAKRAWREGKMAHRVMRPRWDAWTPAHDAFLRKLVGTYVPERIAVLFEEEFHLRRTARGIRVRIYELGLSAVVRDYTAQQVGYFFGVRTGTILRWIANRKLRGQQMQGGVKWSKWLITPEALEAFIERSPEMFDLRTMPRGRWRQYAEVLATRDPLYDLHTVARLTGYSAAYVGWLLTRGTVKGTPRYNRKGEVQKWFMRRSQILPLQTRLAANTAPGGCSTSRATEPTSRKAPSSA